MNSSRGASHRFVVREHRPLRAMLLGMTLGTALGATALLLVGLHFGYVDIRNLGVSEDGRAAERRLLQGRIRDLSAERDRIASALAAATRQQQVESQARDDIAIHLRELQGQISALKQEVAFYRGIVTGARGRGFEVQSFSAVAGRDSTVYRFRVVLTRDAKDDKVQRGFVSFSVDGERNGKPERLSLVTLTGRDEPGYEFRFRYFQKVEGVLELPAEFTPRVVNVETTGSDGAVAGVKRSFDWPGKSG